VNPNVDAVKVVLFGGAAFPTQSGTDPNALTTNTIDWNFGASFNCRIVSFQLGYFLAGDRGVASPSPAVVYPNGGFDNPNQAVAALGFNVPVIPHVFNAIAEINRVHYDGGDTRPPDYSEATLGGRVFLGGSGFSAGGAVRVNIDRWVKYGNKPNNLGGLLQVAYNPGSSDTAVAPIASAPNGGEPVTPAPEPPPAPTTSMAPAPATTTASSAATEQPPVAAAPAPRPTTSTTDEILFDAAKSRLTNIAKAILDGVALRLKNNLSATCVIAASTDAKEKGGDHTALGRARAEAAKDYLVKRHGIDAARIMTDVKGDGDAADATRNRRAVVTVTFP
jgi:outer membrane protein OmpA-like peptidoglycan-associated protein